MTMEQRPTSARPTGVTILAVVAAIFGALSLFLGLAAVGLGGVAAGATGNAVLGGLVVLAGLIALATGAVYLAFAYGAWTLKPWAWLLGMIGAGLGIVSAIVNFLNDSNQLISTIFGIAISAVIIYYLNTPAVKAAFRRA